ncbi:beta strand repeat-containing protein, partial [Flavobacterium aurantiibacter]
MCKNYNLLSSLRYGLKTTKLNRLLFSVLFFVFGIFASSAQVTTNGGSGLNPTYPSLASAITALNAATITSPVSITLTANETAPLGGYSITASGTATNTITLNGGGFTLTARTPQASGLLNDAIIKIIGGDFITISGFVMTENAANTTTGALANNMTEFGVALFYASTTNGSQNVTIQGNTISLNRNYQNTFGIYANSTHSATAVTTAVSATTTAGGNNNLRIYSNSVSNVNNGIVVIGPTAAADMNTGVDIGGSSAGTANTISNFGTTGTFSSYSNVSGSANGILIRNSIGFNVSYNSITSSNGGVTSGTLNGIQVPLASATPTGTFTNTIGNNSISLRSGVTSGAINGITYPQGSASTTSVVSISNNDFSNFGHTVASPTAAVTFISLLSTNLTTTVNGNTFSNITLSTTGTVTFINIGFTGPSASSTKTVNGNSIVGTFTRSAAGSTTLITDGGFTPTGAVSNCQNNNFSNITVTGASSLTGFSYNDGATGGSPTRTVSGNTLSNWTAGTSAVTAMTFPYWSGTSSLSNNTVTNITGQAAITGISLGDTRNIATLVSVASNLVSNLSSTGTGGTVIGISSSNTSTAINITGNTVHTLSTTGATATGILVSGASNTTVSRNKIYNILGSGASSAVNGISVTSGTTVTLANNIIGDLRTPAANAVNPLVGINVSGGTTVNAFYNTVFLNGSSTGALFGSSAISVSTTPTVNLRNNIFVNTSTANGTGLTVAHRRSTTTLTSYASASNNNSFFSSGSIFTDGTNTDASIAAYQTRVSPRDSFSFSTAPTFLSTTGSSNNFLLIDPSVATQLESGGSPVSGITDDFSGDLRSTSAPDVGADEFSGVSPAPSITALNISPAANQCVASSRTISATITTVSGTISSAQIRYAFNGVNQSPIAMTNIGGNIWEGIIPAATPVNASVGWSVFATNSIGLNSQVSGNSYKDAPFEGFNPTVTTTSSSVCAGQPVTLTAAFSAPMSGTLGLGGTTSSTIGGTFFSGLWGGQKTQYIIRASELTSAGLSRGNITSLSFETTLAFSGYEGFNVSMGNTSNSVAAFPMVSSNLTSVFSGSGTNGAYSPTLGVNTLNFSTPFLWDGVSNVVVTFCWSKVPDASSTTTVPMLADTLSFTCSAIGRSDNTSPGTLCGFVNAASFGSNTTNSLRPRFSFNGVALADLSNFSWSDGTTTVGNTNPLVINPTTTTTYTAIFSNAQGCSGTAATTITVLPLPSAPTASNSVQCGPGIPTASVTSTSGAATPTFRWYANPTGGSPLQASSANTYGTSISTTTTFFVTEVVGTCESSPRVPVTVTVNTPPQINITPTGDTSFCGTGGTGVLTASSTDDPFMTYVWSVVEGPGTITSDVNGVLTYAASATTKYRVTGTPVANPSCLPVVRDFTISVFPLPLATLSSNVNGVCATGSAILTSDLAAGTFTSSQIPHAPLAAPSSAVTLVNGGVINVTPNLSFDDASDLDDAGWSNIPIGFNFNFFGTTYSSVSISTNGTVFMGTATSANVSDFAFTTLPSTGEPFNMIAVLAMDNDLEGTNGGALRYWVEGETPNRRFVVSFENVKEFGDTRFSTAQAIFYETTGVVEVHVTSSTNVDRNKLVGINNGNGTIGTLAYASGTAASTNPQNPITSPFAYRFTPPSNYSTVWSASTTPPYDASSFVTFASGTNLFSQTVNPTQTTRYALSYTNLTTGCTNALLSSVVTVSIVSNIAPATTAVASSNFICAGQSSNLSLTGNVNNLGTSEGLTYQWQVSTDSGLTWNDIVGATSATATVAPLVVSQYRALVSSCAGTPVPSSVVTVAFTNQVTSTTPANRCGPGSVTLSASGNGATVIDWFDSPTGGSPLATGNDFTTPFLPTTTTFYASARSGAFAPNLGPANPSIGAFGTSFTGSYMIFDATQSTVLVDVEVFPTTAGSVVIELRDSAGTLLQTAPAFTVTAAQANSTATVVGTPVRVPINFFINPGTGYRLQLGAASTATLLRNSAGAAATYGPSSGLTITGNSFSTAGAGYFYNFYNWRLGDFCSSDRVPVTATIDVSPNFELSSTATSVCPSSASSLITITQGAGSFDTYVWSPDTNRTGDAVNGWQFSPATTTTYTLTASNSVSGCQAVTTLVVNVQDPTISSITASPLTVCNNGVSTLTANAPLYVFSTETGGSLADMSSASVLIDSAVDDTPTASSTQISFPFVFAGVTYNDFSVSPDGWLLFGTNVATSQFTNAVTSATNTPKIYPLWDDLATGTNGNVRARVLGSAPNRILVVEWNVRVPGSTFSPANSVMQAWLYETTNVIEYRYGAMGTASSASAGFTVSPTIYSSITFSNNTASTTTANNTLTTPPAAGRIYRYTPSNIAITWSPTTDLFTDVAATVPYSGQNTITVYSRPAATTQYTATSTTPLGCVDTEQVTVTNNSINIAPITGGGNSFCIGESTPLDFNTTTPGVTWTSSNTSVATVDSNGVVTALTAGTTVIGATITNATCVTVAPNPQTVVISQAVTIVSNTDSQAVVTNGNTSFTVNATGTGLTYQWEVNTGSGFVAVVDDAITTGSNTATLTLTAVPASYNGYLYRVVVTGQGICSTKTTDAALLTVGDTGITSQPTDVTVCEGATNVQYTVVGNGDIVSYQWESNPGTGTVWTPLTNDAVYSGVDTATLIVASVPLALNGFRYRVVIAGTVTSVISSSAALNVNQQISVSDNPVNKTVCFSGGSSTFTSNAVGVIAGRQWQYSPDGVAWTNVVNGTPAGATYSGGDTGTLTVATTNATPVGTYLYRIVYDAPICADVQSASAVLTVFRPVVTVTSLPRFCPGVLSAPISLTGTPSGVTFNISGGTAIGLSNQTGVTAIPSFTPIAGTATLSITPVFNGCSGTPSTFVVSVAAPVAATAGSNSPVCVGSSLNLSASLVTLPGFTINPNSGVSFIDILSTGTAVTSSLADDSEHNLTIPAFTLNGTTYTTARVGMNGVLVLGSSLGDIAAGNAALPSTANTAGNIFIAPYWDDLDIQTGASIRTGTVGDVFIIQWSNAAHDSFTTGSITFQVQLNTVTRAINFVYQDVVFGDSLYDSGISATVGVQTSSTIADLYSFNASSLVNGQSITFTPIIPTYSWTGPNGFTSSLQNPTLPASASSAGTYTVVVTNPATGCSSPQASTVVVVNQSVAGTASSDQTICTGTQPADITLTGNTGTIQWQVSSDNNAFANISGATAATLTAAQMGTLTATRYYRAVVTNGVCSSATSNAVTVTVNALTVPTFTPVAA